MDAFRPVLGTRRGRSKDAVGPPAPPGLLARLDALCAELTAREHVTDENVEFLARGRGFRAYPHLSDDFLLREHGRQWSVALLSFGQTAAGPRWHAYVCRGLVLSVRSVSA